MMKPLFPLMILSLSVLAACHGKPDAETLGQRHLKAARAALTAHRLSVARAHVDSLRRYVPTALNAREEAILLLDSIDLIDARLNPTPDSALRSEFFSKKLEHDQSRLVRH